MSQHPYQHAVVIGSSITGLVSAAVLRRHFDRVTIIERDRLPEAVELRKGIPQATQAHILLKRGQMILEDLFPGLTDELVAAGAVPVNMGSELRWYVLDGWRPRFESEINTLGVSRPLLETTIRRHLTADANVEFIQEARAVGLAADAGKTRAVGVKINLHDSGEVIVSADLVVDASGRATKAPEWLAELGYEPPAKTQVIAHAGYASRYYEVDSRVDWKGMYVQPTPMSVPRGGVLLPNEGNRWHVGLVGIAGDYPPSDDAGFLEFARQMPTPDFYEVLKHAKPLGHAVAYRTAENRMYHYDQLPRYLENFVALGDAVFAFNPVYGQGMTVASVSALELDQALLTQRATRSDLTGLAELFQKTLAHTLAMPWQLATGEDMRWAGTEIEGFVPTLTEQDLQAAAHMGQVLLAANHSITVLEAFIRVMNMVASPEIFFTPEMIAEVNATVGALQPEMM